MPEPLCTRALVGGRRAAPEARLARHMDSVAIGAWDDGRPSAFCSGYGHVVAADGRVVLALGAEVVPHGQELRLGSFVGTPHLQQMAIRYHGHQPDIPVAAADGRVLRRLRINDSNNNTGWYHCIPADVCATSARR